MEAFAGKWIVKSTSNCVKCTEQMGFDEKYVQMAKEFHDPKNKAWSKYEISGDKITESIGMGDEQVFKETFELGKERDNDEGGRKSKLTVTFQNGVLTTVQKFEDKGIEVKYAQQIKDGQLIEEMCCPNVKGAVTGKRILDKA